MKKIMMMLAALVLLLSAAYAEENDLLARIRQKGEIVVATEGAWAPWTYHDENDQLVGFDVEVAQGVAAKLGVDTLDETLAMVLSGRADATLNAEVSFYDYMNVHPDANLKVVALTDEVSQVAMPIRKEADSASLLAAVNQAIDELRAEGELTRISEKYFGKDITAGE